MATQTMLQENTLALTGIVRRWDRRLRLSQTLLWFPRSLLPGLAIGLGLALLSRTRPWLLPQQIALVTLALVALGAAGFALVVWLWRRPSLTSARRFDVQFELGERVSTALELGAGIIHSNDELLQRQLADARAKASAVKVRDHIPLEMRGRDWGAAILLAALLALLLILPNPQTERLNAASAQQTAIDEAAEQMREVTQDIATDTSLDAEARETLLEALQTATNTLEQQNVTPEEAFAAVSDVRSELQERAEALNQESSQSQAALQQAAEALRQAGQQPGGTGENAEPAGTMQQVEQSLDQIGSQAGEMSAAERQQASDALQQAAQALQESNPQASESLQEAAEQLEQAGGDPQPQLQQAQQQMQQQAQQAQQQQEAAQNLNNEAQQAQQSAEQISQAQQENQQQSQQGQEQNQQGEQQSQQEQQAQQGEQQSQEGQPQQQGDQQSQEGQQSQQSEESASGSAEQQSGSQNSNQSQSAQNRPGQGQQQSQQGSPSQAQSASAGDQAGNQAGSDTVTQMQASQSQVQTNNNADGLGEAEFESVNVPQRIGDQTNDGNNIELDPDASDAPAQEGDFSANPDGQVTVPYDQVFSDYADSANRALDSDYVPLGLRDVVRDYFTSLEPRR